MSDPKRATLITVGAPNSGKNNVNKTVRLTINLDESNESKYPALNYKELVIAEERKKTVENGKRTGLDPFSDNDDDVERVAKKFEQKYGGKSTYGRKGRSKTDDFADIGAGYDENDSFIDNTHGYDEMIPPECDTFLGGFYINCGSLEFKSVPENQSALSDAEPGVKRNKRRISSSSSEEESSESSSESESQNEKDPKAIPNGAVDSHKTEHRKKKNKKIEKKKAKKVRRTDSSAATSGKQTSDDNVHPDGESVDSRTSQSDSLTSKPAPSSENAITSDSSRDVEMKVDVKLPSAVVQTLESLEGAVSKHLLEHPSTPAKELVSKMEHYIIKVERALAKCSAPAGAARGARGRAARALGVPPHELPRHAPDHAHTQSQSTTTPQSTTVNTITTATTTTTSSSSHTNKRKTEEDDEGDFRELSDEEREVKIVETLHRLKVLIDERKPAMIASYNAECERVQVERKKMQLASATEGAPHIEKRLPKRRFPWCPRARTLLARLKRLAGSQQAAALLLAQRALPLFPSGFVRMPTLLRQADLSKEIKVSEMKRQRLGSSSQPFAQPTPTSQLAEPIQFPSSLTVTTTMKTSPDKIEAEEKFKSSMYEAIINSLSLSKDLMVEKPEKKDSDKSKEEMYNPPNNIGSITITPVPNNQPKPEKKPSNITTIEKQPSMIRVKSPASLNEMVKKDKFKKLEKNHLSVKDKRVDAPLHVDTNYQPAKKDPSPKGKDEIPQKQIENMRVAENNIPRPALVPVHHSPTFAKPDKIPPEVKKKKDIVIISDLDPLGDVNAAQEPVAVDDSSSDVEVIEESKTDKSEPKRSDNKCDTVPSKDKQSRDSNHKKVNCVKSAPKERVNDGKTMDARKVDVEEANDDIDIVLRNIREMEHSQDPTKFNSNSYGGVITNAKHEKSSKQASYSARNALYADTRSDKDKFTERTSLNKMDGCNGITDKNYMAWLKGNW